MWKDRAFGKAVSVWDLLLHFCWTGNTVQIWNTKKYKKMDAVCVARHFSEDLLPSYS